jgi:hypothetical protein
MRPQDRDASEVVEPMQRLLEGLTADVLEKAVDAAGEGVFNSSAKVGDAWSMHAA